MKTSDKGIKMIRTFEGCVLKTYRCAANVLTIGVGHTGPDVVEGLVWTQAQADAALAKDLERFEAAVNVAVKVPLTQMQFDACVSLAFNIGVLGFASSTLVKKLNAHDTVGAARQFTVWNRAGGQYNASLNARRTAELCCFLGFPV